MTSAGIDDAIVHLHPTCILLRNLTPFFEEEAGQRLQHIRLVDEGYLLASVMKGIFEGEPNDAAALGPRVDPL